MPVSGRPFVCSWSGGKDSCLALYHALRHGGKPRGLLTVLTEAGDRTRSHGLPVEVVRAQAQSLGVPLLCGSAAWPDYEEVFSSLLAEQVRQGVVDVVFGDIDVVAYRDWGREVCEEMGAHAHHPLWQRMRGDLLREFIGLGFEAMVVVVREGVLPQSLLGRTLGNELVEELEASGKDASGEHGEYHTVVTDGPIFSSPVRLTARRRVERGDCWVLDVTLKESKEWTR